MISLVSPFIQIHQVVYDASDIVVVTRNIYIWVGILTTGDRCAYVSFCAFLVKKFNVLKNNNVGKKGNK